MSWRTKAPNAVAVVIGAVGIAALLLDCHRANAQTEVCTLTHPEWVGSVAFFGPRSNDIITGCADGRIRLWDSASAKEQRFRTRHDDVASAIAVAPGGYTLTTGSYDGTLALWFGRNPSPIEWNWPPGTPSKVDRWFGWSPDTTGKLFSEEVVSEFTSSNVVKFHRGAVLSAVYLSPGLIASGAVDGTIKLVNVSFQTERATLVGHKSWVNSLAYDTNAGTLFSASSDGTVRVWTPADGTLRQTLDITSTEVRSIALTPEGDQFAVGLRYGDVQIWRVKGWERLGSFKAHEGDCWAVKFSPDGKTLITGGGDWGKAGSVKLWDAKTGELKTTLKHSGEVLCLAVSAGGSRLAAGGGDGNVKVWDTEKLIGLPIEPKELRTFNSPDWVGSVAFEPFGETVFAGSGDGLVRKWNIRSGENSMVLKGHSNATTSIAIDSRYTGAIYTGSYDGTVRSWTGWHAPDPKEGKARVLESQTFFVSHRGPVLAIACNVNGRTVSGGMDGTIKLLGAAKVQTLQAHKSWVNALHFLYLGAEDALASGSSDGTVKIWSVRDAKLLRTLDVTNTEVRSLACTPFPKRTELDEVGTNIAVGLRYGDVQIWKAKGWERLSSFKAHDGDCWAVKFSPDGKTLITGGGDWGKPGEVKFWDVKTGELKTTLKHSGEVLCVAVSPDGSRLAAGGGDGNVKVWDTERLIGLPKRE